ncbi:MAG: hypothetical protein ABSE86_14625 [Bryobacteraceae bacterium]|jgi:hypothetical protein
MRYQNPVLLSGEVQWDRVGFPTQVSFLDIKDIDRRLARAETIDDIGVEILIREEADSHFRFEAICRRAASRRVGKD